MSIFNCMDCDWDVTGPLELGADETERTPHEYYMLLFPLWEEVAKEEKRGGMLCIGCVEKRLGRKLVKNDFDLGRNKDGGVNNLDDTFFGPRSSRLIDRLTN